MMPKTRAGKWRCWEH